MFNGSDNKDSLPLSKDNGEEQKRSSKEIRKKKTKIKQTDKTIHFMTKTNENKLENINVKENNLNYDTVSEHGSPGTRRNGLSSKQEVLNETDNNGNGNIDLNKNRKDSNNQCELLTQGDENLNVTNKQEYLFDTTDNSLGGKVVDTAGKHSDADYTDSYSSSFESTESSERGDKKKQKKIVETDCDINVSHNVVDSGNILVSDNQRDTKADLKSEREDSLSTSSPQHDQEAQVNNISVEYSDTFQSGSVTKSKTPVTLQEKKEKEFEDVDDNTLTETSWPSYCQDKSNEESKPKTVKDAHGNLPGSDVVVSDRKLYEDNTSEKDTRLLSGNLKDNKIDRKSDVDNVSVKDHTKISLSLSENSKKKNISDSSEKLVDVQHQNKSDANTLSDSSFPSYKSEENNHQEGEKKSASNNKSGISEISNSAKTTIKESDGYVNTYINKTKNTGEQKQQPDTKTPTDTFSNAQRESNDLDDIKPRKTVATADNSKVSNPDDTLEDIEPITNSVAPIHIDNTMAKQKFVRQAVKNSESDVETENVEGNDPTKPSQEPVPLTNGDDGVFSGDSDGETKDINIRENGGEHLDDVERNKERRGSGEEQKNKHDNDNNEATNMNGNIENMKGSKESLNENGKQTKNTNPENENVQDSVRDGEETETNETPESDDKEGVELESVEQIRRNIKIDHSVETVTELEIKIKDLMVNMKDLMSEYTERLNSQPLSDFVMDLDKFKGDFISLRDAYQKYESLFVFLNKCLKDLRSSGDEVNNLIAKRFREEDLTTWMESQEQFEEDKHKLREERIAVERSALAKASEARSTVARAAVSVAESNQLANEAEIEAAEAESLAKKAWESAELALKSAEEARKAAIEKRKADEEARQRAQERAQKKADEEKKIREVENKQLMEDAKQKGTTFKDERKRADDEKARKEAERINPNNWPRYIYSVEPGDYDPGIGCIIRSITGSLNRDDVEVTRVDQDTGILELVESEELVSNIIELKPTDTDRKFNFEQPMSISIPHCAPRGIPGKEPIIKSLLPNGKWTELPSNEIVLDDIKELRFIETRTRKFGTFAVILRLKRDTLTFTKRGNKVFSTVDSRVSLTCKPSMFKMNTNFNIEVQPIELSAVTELKQRNPMECGDLLAASPILKFSILNRRFLKPLLLTMPLPPNTNRPKRPQTAAAGSRTNNEGQESRPLTARPSTAFQASKDEEETDEEIHILLRSNHEETWTKSHDIKLFQARNKDIVSFEIKSPNDRYLILRTKENMPVAHVERIAFMLENSIMYRTIQVFLRQKNDDPTEIVLSCAQSNRTERAIRKLAELGYEEGPNPSKDIVAREGQVLDIAFRGNIQCTHQSEKLRLLVNTHIRSSLDFRVEEIEKFAQKSFHTYRGFAQIYSDSVHRKLQLVEHHTPGAPKKPPHVEVIKERLLLSELLINIPKPDPEPPRPLNTAPVKINVEAPDTKDVLDFVATELGDEWKLLAQYLNLKSVRIQAILRQNTANPDPKRIRYDMLVSWAKRIPRSANKLEILANALTSCGRTDIANELRDKDSEYKKNMAHANKDTHLKRSFVRVAQNPDAVRNWMAIVRRLGVPEDELRTIDQSKTSIQEKCFQGLRKWQSIQGDQATLHMLTDRLRKCRYRQLAREIETIT